MYTGGSDINIGELCGGKSLFLSVTYSLIFHFNSVNSRPPNSTLSLLTRVPYRAISPISPQTLYTYTLAPTHFILSFTTVTQFHLRPPITTCTCMLSVLLSHRFFSCRGSPQEKKTRQEQRTADRLSWLTANLHVVIQTSIKQYICKPSRTGPVMPPRPLSFIIIAIIIVIIIIIHQTKFGVLRKGLTQPAILSIFTLEFLDLVITQSRPYFATDSYALLLLNLRSSPSILHQIPTLL